MIVVYFSSPKFNLLNIESDIKLILAPKSQSALTDNELSIANGIEKLPGS